MNGRTHIDDDDYTARGYDPLARCEHKPRASVLAGDCMDLYREAHLSGQMSAEQSAQHAACGELRVPPGIEGVGAGAVYVHGGGSHGTFYTPTKCMQLLAQGPQDYTVEAFEVNGHMAIPRENDVVYVRAQDAHAWFGGPVLDDARLRMCVREACHRAGLLHDKNAELTDDQLLLLLRNVADIAHYARHR